MLLYHFTEELKVGIYLVNMWKADFLNGFQWSCLSFKEGRYNDFVMGMVPGLQYYKMPFIFVLYKSVLYLPYGHEFVENLMWNNGPKSEKIIYNKTF